MRNNLLIALTVALLLTPVFVPDSGASGQPALMFDMVCPTGTEGFSVRNISPGELDLEGYSVTDGEGTLTFGDVRLDRGASLAVMTSAPEEWMHIGDHVLYTSTVQDGRFSMSDSGDDLYLLDPSGEVIDSFVYGDVEEYTHWDGEPYHRVPKKTVAYRNLWYRQPYDGEEWIDHVPGRTLYHFPRTYEDCTVTPVLFPDSEGRPIVKELQEAEDTVRISMYTFESVPVTSVLVSLLDSGVDVEMFMEASPAGGISGKEVSLLKTLSMHGADIRMIKSLDGYKRFDYVHAKYAVIDDDTSIVTSENWTDYAFGNNRGWGVIVEDAGCASYLTEIYESDREGCDITEFTELYPTSVPANVPRHERIEDGFDTYTASVTTAVSPDYSREALMGFIDSSEERFYSQQLNVDYDWLTGTDNPLTMMEEKQAQGLDVRLQVDVTYDSPDDTDLKDGYGIYSYYSYRGTLDVRYTDGSRLFHNKGMISDDRTWIGSMNWTDASIRENREMCLIVDSKEFTDVFADAFISDWGPVCSGEPELKVDVSGGGYGKQTVLDAGGSSLPFGTSLEWDLDGDGVTDRKGTRAEWRFYRDTECSLTALTPDGDELKMDFTVHIDGETKESSMVNGDVNSEEEESGFIEGPVKYVPLIILIATIILLKRIAGHR